MVWSFIFIILLFIALIVKEEVYRWNKDDKRYGCKRTSYKEEEEEE